MIRQVRVFTCLAAVSLVFAPGAGWSTSAFAQAAPRTQAAPAGPLLADAIRKEAGGAIEEFYASRGFRPLWIERGMFGSTAQTLLAHLDNAGLDGLKSSRYRPDRLRAAIAQADTGDASAKARAEVALTDAFVRYVRDLRRARSTGMEFSDAALKPKRPDAKSVLRVAGRQPSFRAYVESMGWMSPHYTQMRELLRTGLERNLDQNSIRTIRLNIERARVLPAATVRHIVVDSGSARLWYYQGGKQVGMMKVVVGASATQTPMLAGQLNWAVFNPYWNVPDYLVQNNVARKILAGRTLKSMNMQVLSDWGENPAVLDPAGIDWSAIASGATPPRVRELPGPANSMGKVKFLFPNDHGIYLHDTPNRDLFGQEDRHLSNGCIRLEDAVRLGRWMMGDAMQLRAKKPELAVPLPAPVPVYVTYLTAVPTKRGVSILPDVYGRDGSRKGASRVARSGLVAASR